MNNATQTGKGSAANAFMSDVDQFLTFMLGGEEYGIQILNVQEIRGFSSITPIPNMPSYIKGVMNLRGAVVPVLDLRAKFSMDLADYNQFTVIIVVTVGSKVLGLIVDAVSDVLNVEKREIEPAPELGAGVDTSFLSGMAKAGEKLVSLLDIEKIVGVDTGAVVGA